MKREYALFNWLQIKLVADARPDDSAAQETERFFAEILREDHGLSAITAHEEADAVVVEYVSEGALKKERFDRESAYKLLADIEAEPKYNQ